MCWWKFYFILNILQCWIIKRRKNMGFDFCIISLYSIQPKIEIKKTQQLLLFIFELVHVVGFLRFPEHSADESGRTGPRDWDWMVGVLQYTNTFKSLVRQRWTTHLCGCLAESSCWRMSVQSCAQVETADMFTGRLTAVQLQKSHHPYWRVLRVSSRVMSITPREMSHHGTVSWCLKYDSLT